MAFRSPTHARMVGAKGLAVRHSKSTPDEESAMMARVREAQHQRYLARARALPGGDRLSDVDLERRAHQLRMADLAEYRLRAWRKRMAQRLAKGTRPA